MNTEIHNSVLILEENSELRDLYEMGLKANGISSLAASSQEEALNIIKMYHPKLILVDKCNSKLQFEAFKQEVDVILEKNEAKPFTFHLAKPTQIHELVHMVEGRIQ